MGFNIQILQGDFSFECDAARLSSCVNKSLAVNSFSNSGENEKHNIIVSYDRRIYVIGYSSETFIVLDTGIESDANGCFEFVPTTLIGLIKNRKELSFRFESGKLSFKAVNGGKYSGSISTLTVEDDNIPYIKRMLKGKKGTSATLSTDLIEEIRKAVEFADLKDYYSDEQILCAISIHDHVLEVSAHDNFHMTYYRASVEDPSDFNISFPIVTFKLIDRFIREEKEDVEFNMGSKEFSVVGKTYAITLPPIQADDDYFAQVPNYIKSLKEPVVEMSFSADVIRTVDNMFTISDDESRLTMDINNGGKVKISLANDAGKISDAFMSKNTKIAGTEDSLSFMIDPRIFFDLFKKIKDRSSIPMRLYSRKNKGVSSCFLLSASTKTAKVYLVGTYYEE